MVLDLKNEGIIFFVYNQDDEIPEYELKYVRWVVHFNFGLGLLNFRILVATDPVRCDWRVDNFVVIPTLELLNC